MGGVRAAIQARWVVGCMLAEAIVVSGLAADPIPGAPQEKPRRSLGQLLQGEGADAGTATAGPLGAVIPWWQTNQPPSNLAIGPQLGTEAFGALTPGFEIGPPASVRAVSDVPPALRWGPVTAHPHLSYGLTYGNGLLASFGQQEDTMMHTVSPGLRLDLGKQWFVDYTPRLVFYDIKQFRDTVNHQVDLQGNAQNGDWDLKAGNTFANNDTSLVETGQQTKQTLNSTQLSAAYPLTPQLLLDLGVNQALRWTSSFNNTYSWSTLNTLRYRFRPQFDVGLSLGLGYDMVDPGSDMLNERVMGSMRGAFGPTSKFNYSLSGGVEIRQFLDTDAETTISPIVDVGVSYELTSTTLLSLHATQQVSPAYFNDQFTKATTFEATITQRLLGRLNLSVTGGYRLADFHSTVDSSRKVREADYEFVRVGLSSRFLRRGSATIYAQWSKNDSTLQALSFSSNQYGLQLSYGF